MTAVNLPPARRPGDVWPMSLVEEYRRLGRIPDAIQMTGNGDNFRCAPTVESRIFDYCRTGQDYAGTMAAIQWIAGGPKIVDITEDQYGALAQIEVRLEVRDFQMPYPTILVNMPPGKMHRLAILHRCEVQWQNGLPRAVLVGCCISSDHTHDIVTIARQTDGEVLEETLNRCHGTVTPEEGKSTHQCLRVACNMVLAMTNLGCQSTYLFPNEVKQEHKFALKGDRVGKSGLRPSDRLRESPILVTLDRNVKLYHREGGHPEGEPTGREMPFHWRRGHWRRAKVGVGRAETKIVFVRPCMVRADLLGATSPTDTSTTYHR